MFSFVAHTCPDPATSTYDEPIVARQFADLHRLMRETAVTVRRSKIRGERAPDDDDNAEYPQLDFRTMETRLAYEFPWRP